MIIAEVGVNHNGSMNTAKKMIRIASEAGADYVKFQTFKAESLLTKSANKAEYQKRSSNSSESQFEMIKKYELSADQHKELMNYCNNHSIGFLSSPFDINSIHLLSKLNVSYYKIPSGEITNLPYLREIASIGKPIIMSTGMSDLDEVKSALEILLKSGMLKEKITILHCNTEYPTPMEDVNLKSMLTIKKKLGVQVGYSDHTLGIEVPIAAVSLGATVIEKHFTLDRKLSGPDHSASLEPNELKSMIIAIRNIEKAMGNSEKTPTKSELKNLPVARKSIVAKRSIKKGEIFTEKNLTIKRPGLGISPMKWDEIIGKEAARDYKVDDLIS